MDRLLSGICAVVVMALSGLCSRASADFANCDDSQQGEIQAAILMLGPALGGAQQDITSIREGGDTSRFEYWFGPATPERVDYVEYVLFAAYAGPIGSAHYRCGTTFGCLGPETFAWTEHGSGLNDSNFYAVYICDPFFGRDLGVQAGTMIHEYTHLFGTRDPTDEEKAGADTWQEVSHRLAENDPDAAISVAYNFEFYVTDGR